MAVCITGQLHIVKYLVRRGAKLSYYNGSCCVSALAKESPHPKILHWLLVGRFTETRRLTGPPDGEAALDSEGSRVSGGDANGIDIDLILEQDVESYFERNFWFVPARRFVDRGDGSFEETDICPSEFARYKPTYI